MASVHGIFGWASWAVHGAWFMALVHGGVPEVVHGWCASWGLGKSMCIPPGWKKCMYMLPGFGEAGVGVGIGSGSSGVLCGGVEGRLYMTPGP